MNTRTFTTRVTRRRDDSAGFTLIEAMIALAILAFGILTIAAMQLGGIRGNAFAADLSEGTAVTQREIETLLSIPYTALASGNDTVTGSRGNVFTRTWTVTSPTADIRVISVTSTWTDRTLPRPRAVTLTTVRARS